MEKITNTLRLGLGALLVLMFAASAARAQIDHEVVDEDYAGAEMPAAAYAPLSTAEIEDLVGPIALYPDDLISIVLPAATYPVQVVQAARYLQDREGNPDLQPPDDWDDAVVALLNYPEVIEMMNDDLDWTWALGDAFLNQQQDVLAGVSDFRDAAYAAGNLKSDEHQVVRRVEKVIEVVPADPEVIYVPYYEPERVVVYQPYPVYYYHPYPRYSYYYPYPANYGFSYGYFFGVSTAYRLHWVNHSLYTYNYGYRGHPYYGRNYFNRFYYRHRAYPRHRPRLARSQSGYVNKGYRGDRWQPRRRHGARPVARTHSRARAGNNRGLQRQSAGNRQNRSRVNGENRSAASGFVANSRGARQTRSSQRAFSDKNRDQRRLVNRYREDAKTNVTETRRRSADRQGARFASTATGTTSRRADRSGVATRRSAAASRTQPAQTERPARPTQRNRTMARENSRDVALRASTPRRGNTSAPRARARQTTPTASTARRQARPASRPQVVTQSRQVARQPARSAPARQARPAAPPRQARQAQRVRASEKPSPARSKQRSSGGRRSEPRRR